MAPGPDMSAETPRDRPIDGRRVQDRRVEGSPVDGRAVTRLRAIFISDLHLGTSRAQADLLLDFLHHMESDDLYLVGDVIDNWSLKRRWFWAQSHNDVIQTLLRKAREGTRIVYIPGNHDAQFRDFDGQDFGGVAVRREAVHTTAAGRRYLVMHGDKFDGVVLHAEWLAHLGDVAYAFAVRANRVVARVRRLMRLPYWSLSAYLKKRVKGAVKFVSHYEDALVRAAREEGCDGVICGHIHSAEERMMDGIHYCNDGDWVESCTALLEHENGTLELIDWTRDRARLLGLEDNVLPFERNAA